MAEISFNVAEAFGVGGKVVVVTGAAGWIGATIADVFLANGARVALSDRAGKELDARSEALHGNAAALVSAADLTKPDELRSLVKSAAEKFGGIDAVVHCGGIPTSVSALAGGDDEFDRMFHTNLRSAWVLARAAVEYLEKARGCIVNIASVNGHRAMFAAPLYAATKAGLISMTREMAAEFGGRRVRVNSVSPGPIPAMEKQLNWMRRQLRDPHASAYEELFRAHAGELGAGQQPLAVGGRPVDVAMACVYLCSPAARYVSGADVLVDGAYLQAFGHHGGRDGDPFWNKMREFLQALPAEAWMGAVPEWVGRG